MSQLKKIAIIGTGFSGTCTLWHLIKAISKGGVNPKTYEIVTIEKNDINGPGFPYSKENNIPSYLCNNPADQMFIDDNDFVLWIEENKELITNNHTNLIKNNVFTGKDGKYEFSPKSFYPRELFGIYLQFKFKESINLAKELGVKIISYNSYEVVDLEETKNKKISIELRSIKTCDIEKLKGFEKILIGTGHWKKDLKEYSDCLVNTPYPPAEVTKTILEYQKKCKKNVITVYVEGMGPSGIDAILNICRYGEFIYENNIPVDYIPNWNEYFAEDLNIIVGSRSGIFPGIRSAKVSYEPYYLSEENISNIISQNYIPFDSFIKLIDLELQLKSKGILSINDFLCCNNINAKDKLASDLSNNFYNNLMYTIILYTRRLKFYKYLSPFDKKKYDDIWDRHFIRVAVPIPRLNAIKLSILFKKEILKAISIENNIYTSGFHKDIEVKASGMEKSIVNNQSSLIKNLLDKKLIKKGIHGTYDMGGIKVDRDSDFRVYQDINSKEILSENIYSFGPIIAHWQNTDNYAGAFVEAAKDIVNEWVLNRK